MESEIRTRLAELRTRHASRPWLHRTRHCQPTTDNDRRTATARWAGDCTRSLPLGSPFGPPSVLRLAAPSGLASHATQDTALPANDRRENTTEMLRQAQHDRLGGSDGSPDFGIGGRANEGRTATARWARDSSVNGTRAGARYHVKRGKHRQEWVSEIDIICWTRGCGGGRVAIVV